MLNIYEKYTPQQVKDAIGWNEKTDIGDLSEAIMILCDMIQKLQVEVEKLKAARGD